jgi:nitrate/nitrite-specific signal transduction histidine kinase
MTRREKPFRLILDDEEFALTRDETVETLLSEPDLSKRCSQAQGIISGAMHVMAVTITPESLLNFCQHIRAQALEVVADEEGASNA